MLTNCGVRLAVTDELDRATGELGAREVDYAADELGVVEGAPPPRELSADERPRL